MSEVTICILFGIGIILAVSGLSLLIGWLLTPWVVNDIVLTIRALRGG